MADPIRPSLAQMLNPTPAPVRNPAPAAAKPAGFSDALAAQRAFFQQVTAQKITPPTYTAADVARAASLPTLSTAARPAAATVAPVSAPAQDDSQPLRRPGSFLNIVV